jgi:hypothetical protein
MMKTLTSRPLAFIALAGLFYGCQQDEFQPEPTSSIKVDSPAALMIAENCDVIDFENPGVFPRDASGYITGVRSQKGATVHVLGNARWSNVPASQWETDNRANIFNTTNLPDGHPDKDLGTPNWNNTTPALGNVLIVQELVGPHNVASDPNDNAHGSRMEFDFTEVGPVTVSSMDVVDIEQHAELTSRVDFYDAANNKINGADILIAPTGDNGVATVTFAEMKGVLKMVVTFDGSWNPTTNAGSGAIDNIMFCKDAPPPPTCGPCEGKINSLTFKYNGPDNALVIASVKVGAFFLPIGIFNDLDAGETFVLDGSKNKDKRGGFAGTLGTEVILVQTSKGKMKTTSIHTSCSQPIYESYEEGMYITLDGSSKIGGELCAFAPVPEPTCTRHKCYHKCVKKCGKKCSHKCSHNSHSNNHSWWSWKW